MTKLNRTDRYQFTVTVVNGNGGPAVDRLRTYIKNYNKANGTSLYVKLQGRGPRNVNGRKYNQSLPLSHSVYADVYVYERR